MHRQVPSTQYYGTRQDGRATAISALLSDMETSLHRLLDLSQVYACKHIHALACTEMHSYSALDLCGVPMMSSCAKVDGSLVLVLLRSRFIARSLSDPATTVCPLACGSWLTACLKRRRSLRHSSTIPSNLCQARHPTAKHFTLFDSLACDGSANDVNKRIIGVILSSFVRCSHLAVRRCVSFNVNGSVVPCYKANVLKIR